MNVRLVAVGIALTAILTACGSPPPSYPPRLTPEGTVPSAPSTPPPAKSSPQPTRIEIPSIDVDNDDFMSAGLDKNHELIVPTLSQVKTVVWYSASPAPGEMPACGYADGCVQSTVLHAHINGNGVAGAFAKLAKLRKGQKVAVYRTDGKVAHYTVTQVLIFPKSKFPTATIYGAAAPSLVLLTCGPGHLVRTAAGGNYEDQTAIIATQTALTDAP